MVYGPVAPAATCKAIFGHPNQAFAAGATITASTESAGAPASYLLSDNSAEPWRSTDTEQTDIWFSMADDSAFPVGVVGLLFNTFSEANRVRVRVYQTAAADSRALHVPWYDSGPTRAWTPWQSIDDGAAPTYRWGEFQWGGRPPVEVLASRPRHWIHPLMADGQSLRTSAARAVQITITGTCTLGYLQAGMLWVSTAYFPSRNLSLTDFSRGWEDLSISVSGSNGRRQVLDRGRLRRLGMLFPGQSRAVVDNRIETWAAAVGMSAPLLCIPEPGQPATWWNDAGTYGLSELAGSRREETAADFWEAPVGLLEWR